MAEIAARMTRTIDKRPRLVAGVLAGVILFFLLACLLHDVNPVCHYLFGCDHRTH